MRTQCARQYWEIKANPVFIYRILGLNQQRYLNLLSMRHDSRRGIHHSCWNCLYVGLIKAANSVCLLSRSTLVGISVCQQEPITHTTFELHSLAIMPGMWEGSCAQSKEIVLVMIEETTAIFYKFYGYLCKWPSKNNLKMHALALLGPILGQYGEDKWPV